MRAPAVLAVCTCTALLGGAVGWVIHGGEGPSQVERVGGTVVDPAPDTRDTCIQMAGTMGVAHRRCARWAAPNHAAPAIGTTVTAWRVQRPNALGFIWFATSTP